MTEVRTVSEIYSNFERDLNAVDTINDIIEMENPGEVSQILSGITFDRNNIFDVGKSYL